MSASLSGPVRRPVRARWRFFAIGSLIAILVLGLTACGAGAVFQNVGSNLDGGEAPPAERGESGEVPGDGTGVIDGDEGPVSFENLADRQIIKTGEITIEVETVSSAVGTIRAMALQLGGYVGGSQSGGDDAAATLTLRVPAARFDDALQRIHDMDGEVTAEATREQDVTGSVVDLEARIRNLEASEVQYRSLLDRAERIEDILTIQSRLDEVRGQIEQLQAQLEQLSELASLATLTVTVVPAAAPVEEAASAWDPGAIFDSAVAALVGLGQAVAAAAIWLVILGLPLAVALGILFWIGIRVAPPFRRRATPAVEHPARATEQ
jgi:hypothetical protein